MPYRFEFKQVPFYALLFIVTYLSLLPAIEVQGPEISDKVLHFLAYFGTSTMAYLGFPRATWRLALFIILWGIGIELVQWQLPTRTFELLDMVANSLGGLAGWQLVRHTKRFFCNDGYA
ncbi:MAG: VanZ family protein [Pontibacterium sp.]